VAGADLQAPHLQNVVQTYQCDPSLNSSTENYWFTSNLVQCM
jgi:hypothetical protein